MAGNAMHFYKQLGSALVNLSSRRSKAAPFRCNLLAVICFAGFEFVSAAGEKCCGDVVFARQILQRRLGKKVVLQG